MQRRRWSVGKRVVLRNRFAIGERRENQMTNSFDAKIHPQVRCCVASTNKLVPVHCIIAVVAIHGCQEQACSACVSFRFFAVNVLWRERQGGCGKTGLLLRPLSLPSMWHVLRPHGGALGHIEPGRGIKMLLGLSEPKHLGIEKIEI